MRLTGVLYIAGRDARVPEGMIVKLFRPLLEMLYVVEVEGARLLRRRRSFDESAMDR